jgi:hypothetical protein
MRSTTRSPDDLAAELGPDAAVVWGEIIDGVARTAGGVSQEWKRSKSGFGWMCLLRRRNRTLLYLTPAQGRIRVAVVLGERAAALALESGLPEWLKELVREARPYAEGRGIRFRVESPADVALVRELVALKLAPK